MGIAAPDFVARARKMKETCTENKQEERII